MNPVVKNSIAVGIGEIKSIQYDIHAVLPDNKNSRNQ